MATIRNSDAINNLGSGVGSFYLVDSSGTPTGALSKFPIIAESTLTDETALVEFVDEGGNVYTTDGNRKVTLTLTALQRDAESISLAIDTLRGKSITIIKELSRKTVNGKYQVFVAAVAKPTAKLGFKLADGKVGYEFTLQNNLSTVSVSLSTTNSDSDYAKTYSGTAVVAPGKYWTISEEA